jgi:hypothetical protein
MGLEAMGRDEHEVIEALVLPVRQQLVDRPVERLATDSGASREGTPAEGHSVRERRREEDSQRSRDLARHATRDEEIGPQRKMRPVLLESSDGNDQAAIASKRLFDLRPRHLFEGV